MDDCTIVDEWLTFQPGGQLLRTVKTQSGCLSIPSGITHGGGAWKRDGRLLHLTWDDPAGGSIDWSFTAALVTDADSTGLLLATAVFARTGADLRWQRQQDRMEVAADGQSHVVTTATVTLDKPVTTLMEPEACSIMFLVDSQVSSSGHPDDQATDRLDYHCTLAPTSTWVQLYVNGFLIGDPDHSLDFPTVAGVYARHPGPAGRAIGAAIGPFLFFDEANPDVLFRDGLTDFYEGRVETPPQ
jgi:hypothetical protein